MHVNDNNINYFHSLRVEPIPKEIKKFIGNKNIITESYRIQAFGSIKWGYFFIRLIDFMLKDKSLLDYTNLFSPNDYENNNKIKLKCFR